MTNHDFAAMANQKYFRGRLSVNQLSFLAELNPVNTEALEFAAGVLSRMARIGLDAQDAAELLFWEIGSIIPKILPGAWGGYRSPNHFCQEAYDGGRIHEKK